MPFTKTPLTLQYGEEIKTIQEWSKLLDLSISTIRSRLKAGATDEEALQPTEHRNSKNLIVEMDGVVAPIRIHARARGLCPDTVLQRIDRGSSIEEALKTPARHYCRLLTLDGETLSISEWAERLKISANCIYQRLQSGKSVEDALQPRDARGAKRGSPRRGRAGSSKGGR